MLAWAAGQIEPLLLQKLEFVLEENRVYRILLDRHAPHWRLSNPERIALAQKGKPLAHHHHERNHQGLDNVIPFPDERSEPGNGRIIKSARLGGLLNFYHRVAA